METRSQRRKASNADLIVIGLGAMGSSTVDAAARDGYAVIGLEAFAAGHDRGSSHGPTRMIRRSIEEGPQYVPLVLDALPRWQQLQAESDEPIIRLNGAIRIAPSGSPLHAAFLNSANQWGLEHELLDAAEIHRRFPGFTVPAGYAATYERQAGVLFAGNTVAALHRRARRYGAHLHFEEPVTSWHATADGVEVRTPRGRYTGGRLVITAGAWVNSILGDVRLPVVPHRVVNASFRAPADGQFGIDRLPAFVISDGDDGVYGIPAIAGLGVKVGGGGTPVDPDHVDRTVTPNEIKHLRSFVDRFLPGASGCVVSSLTCLYTVAEDGHFVIDTHPEHANVVIASPCSGHGFKYTTAIGPLLADLALTGTTAIPIDQFSLDRFAPDRFALTETGSS